MGNVLILPFFSFSFSHNHIYTMLIILEGSRALTKDSKEGVFEERWRDSQTQTWGFGWPRLDKEGWQYFC